MTSDDYLALQVVIVCVLLFLIAGMTVWEHPEWFG